MGFILMNIVANFHAYKFTHFSDNNIIKSKSPEQLSFFNKIKVLAFGVNNPRPTNNKEPEQYFQTIWLQGNKKIECWYIKSKLQNIRGTVILFHGYSSNKSSLINVSDEFLELGYNTLLVDFMGSGGSEGNQTTLGFKEAEEVKLAFEFLEGQEEKNIYLFGSSMGAVAILKAIRDYDIKPNGIIIECPFGSMYETTCARFRIMNAPTFPMAGLLVFWGGVQNDFWAFGHKPTDYAKKVTCETLLLYGGQDRNVSREEIVEIYDNINGQKKMIVYEQAGHESYLLKYKDEWINDVGHFLKENKKK